MIDPYVTKCISIKMKHSLAAFGRGFENPTDSDASQIDEDVYELYEVVDDEREDQTLEAFEPYEVENVLNILVKT